MKKHKGELKVKPYVLTEDAKGKRLEDKDKRTLIQAVGLLVIVAAAVVFANSFFAEPKEEKRAGDLAPTATPTVFVVLEEEETQPDNLEYLQAYQDFNPNTIGYIKIEDTRIDYPVVQVDNNDYYISHNFDGEEDKAGAIFLDFRCDINDFQKTRNIIIYGHRMKNGTMFKDLVKYEDDDFFRTHRTIRFDTLNETLTWEVFAVFETTTDDYYIETIFPYDELWIDFLKEHYEKSLHYVYENFYADDIVLTLSTCTTQHNGRLVVMAKLQK